MHVEFFCNCKAVVHPRLFNSWNSKAFIQTEKARVEGFQFTYVITKIVATVLFAATLLIFWITKSPTWQGIGIGLTLFAFAGLVVDYFSQERADIYYSTILEALK